jgi:hypothetical protein
MIDFDLHNKPIQNEDISLVLQQIDILFDTKPREVLGDEGFGTNYEKYLFDLNLSNEALKHTVISDLNSLDLLGFSPDVEVHLLQGTEHDIALVEINLIRDDEYYQQIYRINS